MRKKRIASMVFGILPLLMVAVFYRSLPELVPMQWQANGDIRYDEKWKLFIIAGLCFVVCFGMPFWAKIDPRKRNYESFPDVYETITLLVALFFCWMMSITMLEGLYPGRIDSERWVVASIGLLLALMGNVMPKVKSNFFLGIKTPWALSSDTVWQKTHRLSGKLFFFGGLIMLLTALALPSRLLTYGMLLLVLLMVCLPVVMSYVWYRKEMERWSEK